MLAPVDVHLHSTSDWRRVEMTFNQRFLVGSCASMPGCGGGKRGTLWLDSLSLEELALYNVLPPAWHAHHRAERRQRDHLRGGGKDYAPIVDPDLLRAHKDPARLALRLLPGSRIREGDRLLVSYYHAQPIHRGQVTICMSEPKVYDIGEKRHAWSSNIWRQPGGSSAWMRSALAAPAGPVRSAGSR